MTTTDERIAAYADGEMDPVERRTFERDMEADAAIARQVEAERRLRRRVADHYAPTLTEAVPARLSDMIGTGEHSGDVVRLDDVRARRSRGLRRPLWQTAAALAATLVVGVVAGQQMPGGNAALVGRDGKIADAGLRDALDRQLASRQAEDVPVRIGLSFADRQGALCRTFDSPQLAGIACRDGGDWQLRFGAAGGAVGRTEYRQASSGDMLVMQAADAIIQGAALDPEAERAARDRGWRAAR